MPRDSKQYFPVIAVILLFLVLLSGLIPSLFSSTQGDTSASITLESGEIIDVQSPIQTTLHEKNQQSLNVSIIDSSTGEKQAFTLENESSNQTVMISEQNVTATYVHEMDSTSALVKYEYPTFYDNSDLSVSFWQIIVGLFLLLSFLYIIFTTIELGGI